MSVYERIKRHQYPYRPLKKDPSEGRQEGQGEASGMRRWFMSRRMQSAGIRMARDLAWRCETMSPGQFADEWRALTIAVPGRVRSRMLAAFLEESNLVGRAGG